MNAGQRLDDYLNTLRQRLQWAIVTRASAVTAMCVLIVVCAAIVWLAPLGFPKLGVIVSRVVLLASLLLIAVLLFWRPLKRFHAHASTTALEQALPEQQGRIQTFLDLQLRQEKNGAPMLDLLAEDALKLTTQSPIEHVVTPQRLWIAIGIAAAALLALLYLLVFGNAQWGYGSRHLLLGSALPVEAAPIKQVTLHPGNKTVRRNADLLVQADIRGFKPHDVQLFVHFADSDGSSEQWERAAMQSAQSQGGANYRLTLYALRAPLQYYVVADGIKSAEYKVNVVDVPRIESMSLRFSYPQWTGLASNVETKQRDIRAVQDTQVRLSVQASEPLDQPVLVLDESKITMRTSAASNRGDGDLTVTKPGHYHISSRVAGELVALTDDYDVSVINDEPPTIEIVKPGRDWRASSIEEVPVVVHAQDDFRLQQLELRYAVNGGEWRSIKLPANAKSVETKSILQMEELGKQNPLKPAPLVPGDLVTYYAVTKDRKQTAQTDLYMVQVQPFERRFTEGQGGGGGGGGSNEQEQIAERQREIVVATWNLQRAREQQRRTPQQLKESADMLSGLQDKLAEQTTTLVERTGARTSGSSDARVKQFVENLQLAVKAMQPAAEHLNAMELQEAVPNEQQALQMLLRAESSFRDIQVAREQDSQNGGSGSRTTRDITELYELEMDLAKNKYEMEKEIPSETQAPHPEMDAALAKLKELAERQEKLAEQQRQQQTPNDADRWKQEQLRREAEELRRRLQEMARQQSGSQQARSQQSGQSATGSETLKAMESALQAMRNAEEANKNNRKNSGGAAEQASRSLQQAANSIEQSISRPSLATAVDQLAEAAKHVAAEQRQSETDIDKAVAAGRDHDTQSRTRRDGITQNQANKLVEDKQQVLGDLQKLESKLRETLQAQRVQAQSSAAPKTAERLNTIIDELASENLAVRMSRAIEGLERGRADQAATDEGLVTQALQNTANDLSAAAKIAAQESQQRADAADPQVLLAQLAELRRALQAAQNAQPGNQQSNRQSNQSGDQSSTQIGRTLGSTAREQNRDGEVAQSSNALRRQLEAIQNRIAGGTIDRSDLQALRAIATNARHLAGDPLSDRVNLLRSLDRLELSALTAAEKSRKQTAVRAGTETSNGAQDGETVAEYYRRLAK